MLVALTPALAQGGCGAARNQVDPGFPPPSPRLHPAASLVPLLSGQRLRIPVPDGWQVARLTATPSAHQGLVRLAAPCYESIAITGSSITSVSSAQIDARYARSIQGYGWTLERAEGSTIALLAQTTSASAVPNRGTVGSAYVRLDGHRQLAVDFGAGIWPLRRGPCSGRAVARLVQQLRATVVQVFGHAQVVP
jgi:hypothetical protein